MSERAERCENCRFWDLDGVFLVAAPDDEARDRFSECHRYPPTQGFFEEVDQNFIPRFPVTLNNQWCGEFQPNQ